MARRGFPIENAADRIPLRITMGELNRFEVECGKAKVQSDPPYECYSSLRSRKI